MQPVLRPYQIDKIIPAIRNSLKMGHKRIILCAPTGSGKTMMFCFMVAQSLRKYARVLILTDRIELLKQADGAFSKFDLHPHFIRANEEPDLIQPLHCAMIETLYRRAERYKQFLFNRTLIIIDEAHKTAFEKIFPFISPDCIVIGATATPHRTGKQSSLHSFYTDIVQEIDTPDLIEQGYLSQAYSYGVDIDLTGIKKKAGDYDAGQMGVMYGERKIYDGVIENYNRLTPGTKALLFAPNISSSKEVCNKLQAAGISALHLDSEMGESERVSILTKFKETRSVILCNIGILTTGFDCPEIETIILYRATTSLPLFLQMVGRGSRVTNSKRIFHILDFGNNIKTHNFWEAARTWSLEKEMKKKKVPPIKSCPKCNAMLPVSSRKCKYCGFEIPPSVKEEIEREFAELKLLQAPERNQLARTFDINKKAEMAKAKLISPFWVLHNCKTIEEARAFTALMGYKKGFEYHNKERFKIFQDGN